MFNEDEKVEIALNLLLHTDLNVNPPCDVLVKIAKTDNIDLLQDFLFSLEIMSNLVPDECVCDIFDNAKESLHRARQAVKTRRSLGRIKIARCNAQLSGLHLFDTCRE